MTERTYIAIDLKSFYASVECRERGLDPLDTNLVVADESRTDKTICLARPLSRATAFPGAGGSLKSSSASRRQTQGGSMTRRGESWKVRRTSSLSCKRTRPSPLTSSLLRREWHTTWSTVPASIRFT